VISGTTRRRRVGIDLDNTLARYDEVFVRLAQDQGLKVPDTADKATVRRILCAQGLESVWTELQGRAYGRQMGLARPFPGALELLRVGAALGIEWVIVSHRSLRPLAGAAFDLHEAARAWLHDHRILGLLSGGSSGVFIETTRESKLDRVATLDLDVFVDDLSSVLLDPRFPDRVRRVHFAPSPWPCEHDPLRCVASWYELATYLEGRP